jgi:ankyrin repeat protein
VNAFDAKGHTALVLAIQHGRLEIVRALLAHGADPNLPDSQGVTPRHAARIRNSLEITYALEHNGRL